MIRFFLLVIISCNSLLCIFTRGLWAVINNAAIARYGDAELSPVDQMKKVADVNLYGMVRISQAFMPMLRHSGGRVINVTSVRGRVALPFNGMYTMTKWAGEAFSDTLRREMERFGVKVIIIEPGNFASVTGILSPANVEGIKKDLLACWNSVSSETKDAYGRQYMKPILESFTSFSQSGCTSMEPVVEAIEDAVTTTLPKYRYLVPGGNKLLDWYTVAVYLDSYLPEVLMDFLVRVFDPPPPLEYNVHLSQ